MNDLLLDDTSLLTDLYQLTMSACYAQQGIEDRPAAFELFVRRCPENYGYLIAMGLTQALDYLENLRFSPAQIAALQSTGIFDQAPDRFWEILAQGGFTGDVWAVAEGTAIGPHQPLLRIEAPLWQAQIVETYLLTTLNYQTLVATRAARMRDVAGPDAQLMEFGTRRAFGPQAAIWAARAALAAGFDSTSNVLAALQLGVKPAGTMAHALVMALSTLEGDESKAFAAFQKTFPDAPLLIDTYDTIAAAKSLQSQAETLSGVRIDSGDLVSLSQQVRKILPGVPIVASGDLDEYRIQALRNDGACLDHYGIGTQLVTGSPVNGVYKLVELDGRPVMKKSPGKNTFPGRKQIFRNLERGSDRLGLMSETPEEGERPLLQLVMQDGRRLLPAESLSLIRSRTLASVAALPPDCRRLIGTNAPLQVSEGLQALTDRLLAENNQQQPLACLI